MSVASQNTTFIQFHAVLARPRALLVTISSYPLLCQLQRLVQAFVGILQPRRQGDAQGLECSCENWMELVHQRRKFSSKWFRMFATSTVPVRT